MAITVAFSEDNDDVKGRTGRQRRARGPQPGWRDRRPAQRLGVGGFTTMALVAAFGATLLAGGIARWHDRSLLLGRGIVVSAQVVEVHTGTGGRSATIRFTTTSGEEIMTDVEDPPVGRRLDPGAPVLVRYDPDDPRRRVVPTNENQSIFTIWFHILSGAGLLALAGYGAWWWTRKGLQRTTDQA